MKTMIAKVNAVLPEQILTNWLYKRARRIQQDIVDFLPTKELFFY